MEASDWDERYAAAPFVWSAGPNQLFAELTTDLPAGRALDVAAGEGRTAHWLAERGWQVTAVDFSAVGIDKGRKRAEAAGLDIEWVVADLTNSDLERQKYDLVAVLYLHLPPPAMSEVLGRCSAALRPGGRLIVLGHERTNLERGVGGPQDPAILHDPDEIAAAVPDLRIERCERVERQTPHGTAIDLLLVAHAPAGDAAG